VFDLALEMTEDPSIPGHSTPAASHLEILADLRQPAGGELCSARLEGVGDED
jgi:hypothetical protein